MRDWLTRADMLLLMFVTILIGWLYVTIWGADTAALEVEIWSRGERIETLPLAEDRQLTVTGVLGDSHIEIKHAEARFVDSPCSNKLCVLHGWLQHAGETTACLPNQVSLRILGRDPRYDAINF